MKDTQGVPLSSETESVATLSSLFVYALVQLQQRKNLHFCLRFPMNHVCASRVDLANLICLAEFTGGQSTTGSRAQSD